MNTRYYMVIIKGEIKTSEIMSCGYNRNTQKWDVKFNIVLRAVPWVPIKYLYPYYLIKSHSVPLCYDFAPAYRRQGIAFHTLD